MKKNILICSTARNISPCIEKFEKQIKELVNELKDSFNFKISIYENDSTDNTKELLGNINFDIFEDYSLILENINSNHYIRSNENDRVKIMSEARNKVLATRNNEFLNWSDYVLFIDADIGYNPKELKFIIDFEKTGVSNIDILSPMSLITYDNGSSWHFYDSWATRKNEYQLNYWEHMDKKSNVVFNNSNLNIDIKEYYSVYNNFCLYNSEPLKKGIVFGYINKRFNIYDCDTAVICENFRENGYNKIYMNEKLFCYQLM
jgi:hypothetical protein